MSIVNKKNMMETEEFYSNKEMYENAALEFIKEENDDERKKQEEAFLIRGGSSEPVELPQMMPLSVGGVEAFEDSSFGGTPLELVEAKRPTPKPVAMPE